jgi:hypothetical protein
MVEQRPPYSWEVVAGVSLRTDILSTILLPGRAEVPSLGFMVSGRRMLGCEQGSWACGFQHPGDRRPFASNRGGGNYSAPTRALNSQHRNFHLQFSLPHFPLFLPATHLFMTVFYPLLDVLS